MDLPLTQVHWPGPSRLQHAKVVCPLVCLSIQLTQKLAGYWVNSVEQQQFQRGRGRNRNIRNRDASPAPNALLPNPVSTEMQNLWLTLPGPGEPGCGQSLADKSNRAQRLTGNRQGRS